MKNVRSDFSSPKVGDTLTAITTPEDAKIIKYSWKTNEGIEVGTAKKLTVTDRMLGRTLTVTVTGEEGKTFTSQPSDTITEEATLSEVKIDNETPKVGETVTATAFDADGKDITNECSWSWYRVNQQFGTLTKIANQKKNSYTLTTMDGGNTVYAEAVDNAGNILQSTEANVVKATNVVEVQLETPSGKMSDSRLGDIPVVGDTLKVDLHNSQAQRDVDYQWFRGGSAIVGATSDKYTLTQEDAKTQVTVRVTIPSTQDYYFDPALMVTNATKEAYTTNGPSATGVGEFGFKSVVANDISDAVIVLDRTAPSVGQTMTITKILYDTNHDGDTDDASDRLIMTGAGADVSISWKRDDGVKVAGGTSYTVTYADLGHSFTVEASGKASSDPKKEYYGKASVKTESVVDQIDAIAIDVSELTGAIARGAAPGTRATHGLGGTTFSVSATDTQGAAIDAENLDITWTLGKTGSSTIESGSASITIDEDIFAELMNGQPKLVQGNSARPTAQDGLDNTLYPSYINNSEIDLSTIISVTVTGKGNYVGTKDLKAAGTLPAYASDAPAVLRTIKVGDFTGVNASTTKPAAFDAKESTPTGASLSVSTVPAKAAADIEWVWADTDGTKTFTDSGSSYAVPSSDGTGHIINVSGKFKAQPKFNWAVDADVASGGAVATSTVATSTAKRYGTTNQVGALEGELTWNTAGAPLTYGELGTALADPKPLKSVNNSTSKDMQGIYTFQAITGVKVSYINNHGSATESPELGGYIIVDADQQATITAQYKPNVDKGYTGLDPTLDGCLTQDTYCIENSTLKKTIYKVDDPTKLGQEIVFTATATNNTGYAGTATATTKAIAKSARKIASFKVLKLNTANKRNNNNNDASTWYVEDDKTDYANLKSVANLDDDEVYCVVALDSNGELVIEKASAVVLRNSVYAGKEPFTVTDKTPYSGCDTAIDHTLDGVATIIVKPDGNYYVGDTLEVTFTSKTTSTT